MYWQYRVSTRFRLQLTCVIFCPFFFFKFFFCWGIWSSLKARNRLFCMYVSVSEYAFDCRYPKFCTTAVAWPTCIECRIAGCQRWRNDSIHAWCKLHYRNYLLRFCVSSLSHNGKLENCRRWNKLNKQFVPQPCKFPFNDCILPFWVTIIPVPVC